MPLLISLTIEYFNFKIIKSVVFYGEFCSERQKIHFERKEQHTCILTRSYFDACFYSSFMGNSVMRRGNVMFSNVFRFFGDCITHEGKKGTLTL